MPVKAVPFFQPQIRNGVGSFILQCKKITLQYCNWGGSSQGMRELLSKELKQIAAANPKIEFVVQQKSGHPSVIGEYVTGNKKFVTARNLSAADIRRKIALVRDSSGKQQLQKYKYPVKSINESVRGVWSPVHAQKEYRFKI
ncbi:mitochondrial 54S ribosomal protein mL43 [Magnusiomyces paraingens]|uniref:Large ribosomal subunit protein mL43 n=1 Tax=Magnusiomyces paraingens TaxID=2606893 RepID=A0A5E8BDE0_9ASCO|nr:uncharacterized protein SAPINGB_P002210 [Saprochaete ingens]VVT49316.1 unnamed protein product [Saprochaete ingens]